MLEMSIMSLRIIFAGTPAFSLPTLQALLDSPHEVVAVYTQPDRPAGRGRRLSPSPIKQLAQENDIPVEQPESLKSAEQQQILSSYQADVMVVVAYGLLLPEAVLKLFPYGCINVHASLLPRWRGASPIQSAILAGDKESGVTIMQMDKGLDTGDMLSTKACEIADSDTSEVLHDALSALGGPLLVETLNALVAGEVQAKKQDNSLATYAHKIKKADAQLNWDLSAQELVRQVRAYNPWPIAFTYFNGQPLRIWAAEVLAVSSDKPAGTLMSIDENALDVACGDGMLRILKLQLPGGRAMNVGDFLNAHRQMCVPGSTQFLRV